MSQLSTEVVDDSEVQESSEEGEKNPGSSGKYKTNNVTLARENARLRKDIQKYRSALNEYTTRCNSLEMAWRRRGEALSKIDIISRLAGNQMLKLVDTLSELRSACQSELTVPLERVSDEMIHLRRSMPDRSKKSALSFHSKSQLVNHVNPMISGHPIIKPTIQLRRLNLGNVPRPQGVEVQGHIEEVDLTAAVGNSSDSSDEEDVVEVRNSRNISTSCLSSFQNIVLPVAEVPLERLSLSSISGKINESKRRRVTNLSSRDVTLDNSICSPLEPVHEPQRETLGSRSSDSPTTTAGTSNCLEAEHYMIEPESASPVSNIRKYLPSSQSRLLVDRSTELHSDIEKCRLVVALKDVGSQLQNGTLNSIEQLEERKVKTGASAYPESKDDSRCVRDDSQINVTATSVRDNIELDFTRIGTLDYNATPLDIDNVEGSSLSPAQEFINKLQNEDPLEGPSWRYENVTSRGSKRRHNSQRSTLALSKKDNKRAISNESPVSTPKRQSINSSILSSKQTKLKTESASSPPVGETELTESKTSHDMNNTVSRAEPTSDSDDKQEDADRCSLSNTDLSNSEVSKESPAIGEYNTRKQKKLFSNKTINDSDSDVETKTSLKWKAQRNKQNTRNNRVIKKKKCYTPVRQKKTKLKKMDKSVRNQTPPVSEDVKTEVLETETSASENAVFRRRRKATSDNYKEPSLRSKLRRQ